MGAGLITRRFQWVFSGQRMEFSQTLLAVERSFEIPNSIFNLFNTQVNVAYVLDVFGGARRGIEALKAAR